MAKDSPGQVVDRFLEAYRAGSVEKMLQIYANDAVFDDVAQRHHFVGSEQLQVFLSQLVAVHSKIGLREKRRVVMGNTVVVEYEYTGVLSGAALRQATGQETCQDTDYVLPATSWYEVKKGRIQRQRDFIDLATLEEIRKQAHGVQASD